jgi:hypothetical protein
MRNGRHIYGPHATRHATFTCHLHMPRSHATFTCPLIAPLGRAQRATASAPSHGSCLRRRLGGCRVWCSRRRASASRARRAPPLAVARVHGSKTPLLFATRWLRLSWLQDATAVCDTLAAAVMMMMPLLLPLAARLVMWLLLRVAGSSHASQAGWSRARSSSPSSKSSTASLWRSRSADRPRVAQICSAAHHSASDVCGCHVAAEMPFAWFE